MFFKLSDVAYCPVIFPCATDRYHIYVILFVFDPRKYRLKIRCDVNFDWKNIMNVIKVVNFYITSYILGVSIYMEFMGLLITLLIIMCSFFLFQI